MPWLYLATGITLAYYGYVLVNWSTMTWNQRVTQIEVSVGVLLLSLSVGLFWFRRALPSHRRSLRKNTVRIRAANLLDSPPPPQHAQQPLLDADDEESDELIGDADQDLALDEEEQRDQKLLRLAARVLGSTAATLRKHNIGEMIELRRGDEIALEQRRGALHLVLQGTVAIVDKTPARVGELRRGHAVDFFELFNEGEEQTEKSRSSETRLFASTGDTCVLRVSRADFAALLEVDKSSLLSFARDTLCKEWRVAHFARQSLLPPDFFGADDKLVSPLEVSLEALGIGGGEWDRVSLAPRELLFPRGSRARAIYVVLSGSVHVDKDAMGPGTVLGLLSVLSDTPHLYTVRGASDCQLAAVPLAQLSAAAHEPLLRLACRRMAWQVSQLLSLGLQRQFVRSGRCLMQWGDAAANMFVVCAGRLRVTNHVVTGGTTGTDTTGGTTGSAHRRHRAHSDASADSSRNNNNNNNKKNNKTNSLVGRLLDDVSASNLAAAGVGPGSAFQLKWKAHDASRRNTVDVTRGHSVGELALLAGEECHTNFVRVDALRDTVLLRVSRAALNSLLRKCPRVAVGLVKRLSGKATRGDVLPVQRSSTSREEPREMDARAAALYERDSLGSVQVQSQSDKAHSVIAVVPITPGAERYASTFSAELIAALREHGKVARVTLGPELGSCKERLAFFLSRREASSDFVVLDCENEDTAAQADCILFLADASDDCGVTPTERRLGRLQAPGAERHLVLLHEATVSLPRGTRRWTDRRLKREIVHRFSHVRMHTDKSVAVKAVRATTSLVARLARVLAGRAVGLVLSGGGARGLAHGGVFRALEEQGVPIDYVGGTSQGAFMAALLGMHRTHARIMDEAAKQAAEAGSIRKLLRDATLPIVSYFSGHHVNLMLKERLSREQDEEEVQIEDLWIPFFCVSVSVSRADLCVHRSGDLWRSVRASMSILEWLPFFVWRRELLIDGGYVDNMPVDTLRELFAPRLVIAVDVESKDLERFERLEDFGDSLSGWWLFLRRLRDMLLPCLVQRTRIPRFAEVIASLVYIQHNRNLRAALQNGSIDVYIRPELGDSKLLDYHKLDEIAALGYRFARAQLTRWQVAQAGSDFAWMQPRSRRVRADADDDDDVFFATDDDVLEGDMDESEWQEYAAALRRRMRSESKRSSLRARAVNFGRRVGRRLRWRRAASHTDLARVDTKLSAARSYVNLRELGDDSD